MSLAEPIADTASATSTAASASSPEMTEAFNRFNARYFEGALKLLREAAKKNPDLPPAQVMMARLFAQAKAFPMARNALEQAVVEDPNDPDAYIFGRLLRSKSGGLRKPSLPFGRPRA